MITRTGCDGVAIGRAALGNPWVFAEIRAALAGESFTPPTEAERRREALRLARDIVDEHGDSAAARECRGRVAHFSQACGVLLPCGDGSTERNLCPRSRKFYPSVRAGKNNPFFCNILPILSFL
jgi:tRNA-dihydrouridine synthase